MSTDASLPNGRSFISRAGDWLFQQGVSTVLLGFIAIGAWYGIPAAVHEVKDTILEEKTAHKEEVKELSTTFERTLDRVMPPRQPAHAGGD